MARVTVEDCIQVVENRFELVVLAAERAKRISSGAPVTVSKDNDKYSVIALREIADNNINIEKLRELVVQRHRRGLQSSMRDEEVVNEVKERLHEEFVEEVESLSVREDSSFSFNDDVEVED